MTIIDHTPQFSLEDANKITYTLYEIYATTKPLPSERNQNFLLQTNSGERFVLKIATYAEEVLRYTFPAALGNRYECANPSPLRE